MALQVSSDSVGIVEKPFIAVSIGDPSIQAKREFNQQLEQIHAMAVNLAATTGNVAALVEELTRLRQIAEQDWWDRLIAPFKRLFRWIAGAFRMTDVGDND